MLKNSLKFRDSNAVNCDKIKIFCFLPEQKKKNSLAKANEQKIKSSSFYRKATIRTATSAGDTPDMREA